MNIIRFWFTSFHIESEEIQQKSSQDTGEKSNDNVQDENDEIKDSLADTGNTWGE